MQQAPRMVLHTLPRIIVIDWWPAGHRRRDPRRRPSWRRCCSTSLRRGPPSTPCSAATCCRRCTRPCPHGAAGPRRRRCPHPPRSAQQEQQQQARQRWLQSCLPQQCRPCVRHQRQGWSHQSLAACSSPQAGKWTARRPRSDARPLQLRRKTKRHVLLIDLNFKV